MLDEAHEDCGKRLKDDNTYVIGHITGHNCVLACLPVGLYGTTSATSVATEMRFTFPLIEFWLLVGIRGGAPGAHADIRLGDAVVGIPSPGRDGVIPYDYGKTLAEGKFIQTASINKPPVAILTAVSKLQAGDRTKQQTSISEMAKRSGQVLGMARPPRSSEDPKIHYRTTASGNQVIKDAATRDKLAKELAILCFKIEAAGVVNFPFLSIHSTCNYADAHKNKQWQGYLAAAAAAYAQKLLTMMSPVNMATPPAVSEIDLRKKQESFIDSIWFDRLHSRHNTIKGAHARTCK
ncbi:nucleoside phosphorylase domain-containing protein [Aspergillus crustosus]